MKGMKRPGFASGSSPEWLRCEWLRCSAPPSLSAAVVMQEIPETPANRGCHTESILQKSPRHQKTNVAEKHTRSLGEGLKASAHQLVAVHRTVAESFRGRATCACSLTEPRPRAPSDEAGNKAAPARARR